MAGWFAKLMQNGHARSRLAVATAGFPEDATMGRIRGARDPRYDALVQMLRDREAEDRAAREKRQRGYRQSLESDSGLDSHASSPSAPVRLSKFPTKVPCRATPQARVLLDELRRKYSGATITFSPATSRRQAVMLTECPGAEPRQIGWLEPCVQSDPKRCDVRHQGLAVETDGSTMLVMRLRYPSTPVKVWARRDREDETLAHRSRIERGISPSPGTDGLKLPHGALDDTTSSDFAELRLALDMRPSDRSTPPRLVWVTRAELATMNALRSRDFEAFYVRFKLEVLAGIWSALSAVLSGACGARWHRGAYYTVVRDPDATNGKIYQRTVDDAGRVVDVGANRIYDAAPATDILLLYLDGDLLADFADIYFTLQSVDSADAYFLKEELFMVIRRFWAGAQSLTLRHGSDVAAVVRMSQRTVPMPAQASMLRQDWTNLRQSLVDRYGDGGCKAADLVGAGVHRPRGGPVGWPFASFPAGDVNVGLRLIYRQEWSHLGAQRGDVIRSVPPVGTQADRAGADVTPTTQIHGAPEAMRRIDTIVEHRDTTRHLDEVVRDAVDAAVDAMKWPLDQDGRINVGVRALASRSDMGLEQECRESSRDTSTRLSEAVLRMTSRMRGETSDAAIVESAADPDSSTSTNIGRPGEFHAATYVYSRLQNAYEVLTRPAEIQNVILVAERLPSPTEIDLSWVRRHRWILAKVLLDESLRDTLDAIGENGHVPRVDDTTRDRLYEHLRANILHYQRAVWQQEDPQQRSMRYRKSGRRVPLEWRFELEAGAMLTIDELAERLAAAHVDGQFATYSDGRDAALDQVIDPAGPIAYFGNCAVYQMRPEFGSEELFSMLHFFKSPYLRPNPSTGALEIDDPALIDVDPAQYRRERARRTAIDTDSVVIDVIRSAESVRGTSVRSDDEIHLVEAPAGFQMLLAGSHGVELLSAPGHRAGEGRCTILRGIGEPTPSLLAGTAARTHHTHDRDAHRVIRMRDERMPRLLAGRAHDPESARVIVARDERRLRLTAAAAVPADAKAILPGRHEGPALTLCAGRARDTEAEGVMLVLDGSGLTLSAVAGVGTANPRERVILAGTDEWLRPSLVAGSAR